jgi:hypothetical protein
MANDIGLGLRGPSSGRSASWRVMRPGRLAASSFVSWAAGGWTKAPCKESQSGSATFLAAIIIGRLYASQAGLSDFSLVDIEDFDKPTVTPYPHGVCVS